MARAFYETYWQAIGSPELLTDEALLYVGKAITAAILAAEARGFKLVGPEATDDMAHAGTYITTPQMWRAMHDAAPKWEDKT